ncbi:MAG: hypothetical protein PHI47_11900 [Sulfuricurvum sp.]|uniref:hypothetical protein n=1 Tax=Sulfuricurvum sp. TaxID=2025608 RepID=UPI0026365EE3|nr:hypothetical protein [Sulfuricurvum sp.]MDD5160750.1 hypothetical protein [Sulfuricurvum sp.]
MKKRNFWTILLLLSFSFSIVNDFVIEANEKDHCSIQQYVQEFSQPTHCGDLCDIRYMFHISFILPAQTQLVEFESHTFASIYNSEYYISHNPPSNFRPPIAA